MGKGPMIGIQGPPGAAGPPGPAGVDGQTVLNGSGAPGGGTGQDGDFYIDTDVYDIYGPKAAGVWGGGTSLVGPAGADGQTVLNGSGAPGGGTGQDGDFYIDTDVYDIYGPKAAGVWGAGTSLVGPAGSGGLKTAMFPAESNGNSSVGNMRDRGVGATANFNFNFWTSADFTTLASATVIGIPSAGAAGAARDIDLDSTYGDVGMSVTQYAETDTAITYDLTGTSGQFYAMDVSSVLNNLGPSQFGGINIDHNSVGGTIEYLALLLRWN